MKASRKSLLAAAALVGLAAAPSAQGRGIPTFRRVAKPPRPVTLDLQTGTITPGPPVPDPTLEVTIFNGNRSGFVGVDTGAGAPNGPCEWIDVANKSIGGRAGGATGLLAQFEFAYCSAALDPNSGGPGGAVCIGFRQGYTSGTQTGSAPTGTDVGTFSLTGLPANTNSSSFFGGFSCFLITVSLGNLPICFGGDGIGPEPNVSWSWQFKDLGTDGVLAKTFPFLSCIASCSNGPGTVPGPGLFSGQGMQNGIDRYCPAGSLLSSFTFSSANMTNQSIALGFASIDMTIWEASISTAAITVVNAAPNNQGKTASMALAAPGAALGLTANFVLGCQQASANGLTIFRLGFGGLTPALPSKWGDILVPITAGTGITIVGPSHGQGILVFPAPIPKNFNFANTPFGFQGFCGDSPVGFTSQGIGSNVQLLPLL